MLNAHKAIPSLHHGLVNFLSPSVNCPEGNSVSVGTKLLMGANIPDSQMLDVIVETSPTPSLYFCARQLSPFFCYVNLNTPPVILPSPFSEAFVTCICRWRSSDKGVAIVNNPPVVHFLNVCRPLSAATKQNGNGNYKCGCH